MTNLILNTDSYKSSHFLQYPPNTERVYAYVESRGGAFNKTVFFGLQAWLKQVEGVAVTVDDVAEAAEVFKAHGLPFNLEGWNYIAKDLGGKLPIEIKAIPEGTLVPGRNVLATIVNTDPECFWLTSYLETQMLRAIWYPTTVATISWHCKQIIKEAIEKSSDDPAQIAFKLHDFGGRGVSSNESAGIGGAAHLVNFMGTDTVEALMFARKYYDEQVAGFSIPASEHSTITSWGRDRERDAYFNMLMQFGIERKTFACVSDSYDINFAVEKLWGMSLKSSIENLECCVVIRPDSGDPLTTPIKVIQMLDKRFGSTLNSKGYKVLNPYVRVIQGDGITIESIPVIIANLLDAGYAIDNLAFGMGGGLLQQCNRDTLKFAMKTSAAMIGGHWTDVFKDPIDDPGKQSKKGRFSLVYQEGVLTTMPYDSHQWEDELKVVFRNGMLENEQSFSSIRERANKG